MKLSVSDYTASFVVVVLCSVLFYFYVQERGRSTVRADEAPLGTIVFKKLSATRRLRGGLVWERIHNNSPVYQADTLRTAGASEASVYFDDGTSLDMYENSMLRLDFQGQERVLEFLGGDITVQGPTGGVNTDLTGLPTDRRRSGATAGYTITAGDRTIAVEEGAQASLVRTGDTLSVDVLGGVVALTGADGTTQTVGEASRLQVDLSTGDTRVVAQTVFPLHPDQAARFLVERAGSARVEFAWRLEGTDTCTVELSDSRDFTTLTQSVDVSGLSQMLEVEPGTWYWRVRAPDGTVSSTRRFTLYAQAPPRPILPTPAEETPYREKLPAIRFAWTEMEAATAYIFEVAPDPSFTKPVQRSRTTLQGLTVDKLAEGTWYWRVLAVHPMSLLEPAVAPEVRTVVVRRRAQMTAPVPTVPLADALFLVQEVAGRGIAFSWVPQPEAVGYELHISRSQDLADPVIQQEGSQTWFTLAGPEAVSLERPQTSYWAVRWKDDEGNLSPFSQPRALQGVDGALAVRLSFPPDGYTIADSLISSTRFAWKCNVPALTVFQLSEDPGFSSVAFEEPSDTQTIIGRQWKTGVWYWRIRTLNADGSVLHDTEPRRFGVVDPLPAPPVLTPAPGTRFHLRIEDPYTIRWDDVAGADYYQFRLYHTPTGGAEELRHTLSYYRDTSVELPFGEYPDGAYRVALQAFCLDKEMSTRIIGYLGGADFSFRRILRIRLVTPVANTVFEGLDARRNGVSLAWDVPDPPQTSELVVSADPGGRTVLERRPGGSGRALLERLGEGDYYWTVKAQLYGFDISAQETNSFSVRVIPLLETPQGLTPPLGFRYGPEQLRGLSAVRFTWDAVPDATRYVFSLYRVGQTVPMAQADSLAVRAFTMDDISVFRTGEYRWTVRALAYDAAGQLEQDGRTAESRFRIELPSLVRPATREEETFYGR